MKKNADNSSLLSKYQLIWYAEDRFGFQIRGPAVLSIDIFLTNERKEMMGGFFRYLFSPKLSSIRTVQAAMDLSFMDRIGCLSVDGCGTRSRKPLAEPLRIELSYF